MWKGALRCKIKLTIKLYFLQSKMFFIDNKLKSQILKIYQNRAKTFARFNDWINRFFHCKHSKHLLNNIFSSKKNPFKNNLFYGFVGEHRMSILAPILAYIQCLFLTMAAWLFLLRTKTDWLFNLYIYFCIYQNAFAKRLNIYYKIFYF